MSWVLDTTALLAHYFREPGWDVVVALLAARGDRPVRLAAPSLLEFHVRATAAGVPVDRVAADLATYLDVLGAPVPVDRAAAELAAALRSQAVGRVPTVDALIAGCAVRVGAGLVHRDHHFHAIPSTALEQLELAAR